MAETVQITSSDIVLDAGCGVGGSSIYLAKNFGCRVVGVTLSERQMNLAYANAEDAGVTHLTEFKVMDYSQTIFPDEYFDVVWGCESICYAESKEQFIREASRILKQRGRLVVADGFVTALENNTNPIMRTWVEGWAAKSLESTDRFMRFMKEAGFSKTTCKDITAHITHSARRIARFYYPAKVNHLFHRMIGQSVSTIDVRNVEACRFQWLGLQQKLWMYGLMLGIK